MAFTAIITAGGTTESIDDVRFLTTTKVRAKDQSVALTHTEIANISKGGFGRLIAQEFLARGVQTTLIGRRQLVERMASEEDHPLLKLVPFQSVADLTAAITQETSVERPDFFLMAAAVSDFSPIPVKGKISSSTEVFHLPMRRNPKLLDGLRDQVGSECTLVGFKLVSRLSDNQLISIAAQQNARARLDYTVGNDLQHIDFVQGVHPIKVVDQTGAVTPINGQRQDVARTLVAQLLEHKHLS